MDKLIKEYVEKQLTKLKYNRYSIYIYKPDEINEQIHLNSPEINYNGSHPKSVLPITALDQFCEKNIAF